MRLGIGAMDGEGSAWRRQIGSERLIMPDTCPSWAGEPLVPGRGRVSFSEKRKVGGSTPPLTTHYHQRIMPVNCGNVVVQTVSLLPAHARSRPRVPAVGRCLVHVGCTARLRCTVSLGTGLSCLRWSGPCRSTAMFGCP